MVLAQQFEWRPRPPSLLSGEQQRKVRKDLRKFERRFDKVRSPVGYCRGTRGFRGYQAFVYDGKGAKLRRAEAFE